MFSLDDRLDKGLLYFVGSFVLVEYLVCKSILRTTAGHQETFKRKQIFKK